MDFINTSQKCNDFDLYFYPKHHEIYTFLQLLLKKKKKPEQARWYEKSTCYSLLTN